MRSPLNDIKQKLIVFENVDMVSATVDPTTPSNAHYAGETHSLAAANRANGDTAGGPSIDQYIAKAINAAGPVTKVPSLSLAAQNDGNVSGTKVCTAASNQVVSLEPNAAATYKRLFANFTAPAMPTMTGPSPQEIAAQQQKSVLDLVLSDFAAVSPKLSTAARTKMDAHASAVRDLEKRLALGGGAGSVVGSIVQGSDDRGGAGLGQQVSGRFDSLRQEPRLDEPSHPVRIRVRPHARRLARCRRTVRRRVGVHVRRLGHDRRSRPHSQDVVQQRWHVEEQRRCDGRGHQAAPGREPSSSWRWSTCSDKSPKPTARRCSITPSSCGAAKSVSTATRSTFLPWIMAGGSAVGFKPGRYLKYPRTNNKGAPHNNLFVSIAQAMGVNTNTFGNASVCTGPLDGLRV